MTDKSEKLSKYSRPETSQDSLQMAILKWMRHQWYIWKEAKSQPIELYAISSTIMRVMIIAFAGAITTMSDIETVPRTVVTIVGGVMTVLTGVEGYLKLADRKVASENRMRELLAERDKWGYQWMVQVELETDTDKALEAAKKLLISAPQAVNDLLVKYASRSGAPPATEPK